MKEIINEEIIQVRPKITFYVRTEKENGETFRYISRDNINFTKYKLMNEKLYIRQKK